MIAERPLLSSVSTSALRAEREDAPALAVRVADRALTADEAGRGKVRPGDEPHQLVDGQLRGLDERDQRVAHLAQVVRRDVRRHADGDARGAVDQQVRHAARQDERLGGGVVEVGTEVDRLLVDVGEQLLGELRQPALGVAVRRRRIAVDGAEVALPVDQRVAQVPLLRETDQGVVDRAVAVRVVPLEDLAHDAGALRVAAVVEQALAEHGVEDAAMDGLQPVARVGQRTRDDDRHRVVHEGLAHLVFDVDGNALRVLFHGQLHGRRGLRCRGSAR